MFGAFFVRTSLFFYHAANFDVQLRVEIMFPSIVFPSLPAPLNSVLNVNLCVFVLELVHCATNELIFEAQQRC